jgi:hypothetical protein
VGCRRSVFKNKHNDNDKRLAAVGEGRKGGRTRRNVTPMEVVDEEEEEEVLRSSRNSKMRLLLLCVVDALAAAAAAAAAAVVAAVGRDRWARLF